MEGEILPIKVRRGEIMDYGLFLILGLLGVTLIITTIMFSKSMKE